MKHVNKTGKNKYIKNGGVTLRHLCIVFLKVETEWLFECQLVIYSKIEKTKEQANHCISQHHSSMK